MLSAAGFPAMGTTTVVAVNDGRALGGALRWAGGVVRSVDATCSRFDAGSELSRLNRRAGTGPVGVSPLLGEALDAALGAAAATGGLVDLTVGRAMERAGYTVTFRDLPADGPALRIEARPVPGFRVIRRGPGWVDLPSGVVLDLGAVGKAWAADRAAAEAAARLGTGVLVCCGGDVAVAGPPPRGGWRIRVGEGVSGGAVQDVLVGDGGLATSGRALRCWRRGGRLLHHILDPATGLPVETGWRTASVAAATCAEANAGATAALILGDAAPAWLAAQRLPARLIGCRGEVVTVAGWPGERTP